MNTYTIDTTGKRTEVPMTAYRTRLDAGTYAQGAQAAPPAKRRPGRPRKDDPTAPSNQVAEVPSPDPDPEPEGDNGDTGDSTE